MAKRIVLIILLLLLVVGGLAGIKVLQVRRMIDAGKHKSMPPAVVSTAVVEFRQWQTRLPAVGTLTAVQGVTVTAELSGKVTAIEFTSGSTVSKGDILVRQDTVTEEAQLKSALAAMDLAEIDRRRSEELVRKKSMARSRLDTNEARLKEAAARVDEIRAVIAKKTIRAPFSGRLGIRQVNLGQFLGGGDPVVDLQSLDPIYVDFSLPQRDVILLRPGLPVELTADTLPGEMMTGTIIAVNPGIDTATRNIRVRAQVENSNGQLRPGMFVRVQVVLPEKKEVLIIPATAVLSAPYGDSVFVVEPRQGATETGKEPGFILRKQVIRTGEARGDYISVTSGLQPGEKVVSTGVFKYRNGQPAVINNRLAPAFSEHPTVENR